MKNDYEIRGDVTAIFLKRKSGEIVETIIDTKDLSLVQTFPYTWCANWFNTSNSFYVSGSDKGRTIYLHRFLLNFPENMVVDHINHDPLDNTRTNLRIVTKSENGKRKKKRRK